MFAFGALVLADERVLFDSLGMKFGVLEMRKDGL
jgi:hypothetical protein